MIVLFSLLGIEIPLVINLNFEQGVKVNLSFNRFYIVKIIRSFINYFKAKINFRI